MHMNSSHNLAVQEGEKVSDVSVDAASPTPASAYDRLIAAFGGAQKTLVTHLGRHQSTISKWAIRGVPVDAAPDIVLAAERAGIALSLPTLLDWIMADRRRRG